MLKCWIHELIDWQYELGYAPRTSHYNIPRSHECALHICHLPQHRTVCIRGYNRLRVPRRIRSQGPQDWRAPDTCHLSFETDSVPASAHCCNKQSSVAIRIRKLEAHRLCHFHIGEEL